MAFRKDGAKRKKRLSIEPLEPRRLLDVSGVWQELGFRSASGGGVTYNPFYFDDNFLKVDSDERGSRTMAVDQDGLPIVVTLRTQWLAPSTIYVPPAIVVEKFNGFRWYALGGAEGIYGQVGAGYNPAIDLDSSGKPYVIWEVGDNIYLRYFDGNIWRPMSVSDPLGQVDNDSVKNREPDIVIGADDQPIVTYTAYDESGQDMEVVVKKWDGERWVELTNGIEFGKTDGVLANLYGGGVSDDIYDSKNPSITVDQNGYPIVAWTSESFQYNNEIYIRQWNGSEWREIGTDSASGPIGKYGADDTHPSRGISNDDTMSLEPVVRVDNNNTIIVAWIDYQDYANLNNAGIYVKKYEQAATSPSWVPYSTSSASGRGITPYPVSSVGLTFQNLSMDIGPHSADPTGTWTPVLGWSSVSTGLQPIVARFNPTSDQWEYLVGDGEDPMITNPLDGPHSWYDFILNGSLPDATGWRQYTSYLPAVAIDPSTGHELLTYSNQSQWFPDWEVYVQQYRNNVDYFEVRDLDELITENITVTVAWADAPSSPVTDLTVKILDQNGAPIRVSEGGVIQNAPVESYTDPVVGNQRGLIRLKVEGASWGERNYIVTVNQGGSTQTVAEAEPNDTFLSRQVISSASGNQEARTVQIGTTFGPELAGTNNQWVEMGRGSMSFGGVDDSPTRSTTPRMATSQDGRAIMAYIESNRRGDAWLEVKIYDPEGKDEYGQPGAWVNLTDNAPLFSSLFNSALQYSPETFDGSLVKIMDISCDPWIINDLNGRLYIAITDGDAIDVYKSEYMNGSYTDLELVGGTHAAIAPTGGKIVWLSIQSGPNGEAALAWEWLNQDGMPVRELDGLRADNFDYFEVRDLPQALPVNITFSWDAPYNTGQPPRVIDVYTWDGKDWVYFDTSDTGTYTGLVASNIAGKDEPPNYAVCVSLKPYDPPTGDEGGEYTLLISPLGATAIQTTAEREPNNEMGQRQIIDLGIPGLLRSRKVSIAGAEDYPRLGSSDIYVQLLDPATDLWQDMQSGSRTAPDIYGVGGLTGQLGYLNAGMNRYPDLTFVPTPADAPGTGQNVKGSYVLAWSYGDWYSSGLSSGESGDGNTDGRFDTGFQSFGIKAAWYDKNTNKWTQEKDGSLTLLGTIVDEADLCIVYAAGNHDPAQAVISLASRKWPSVTIGDTGHPFISFTTEFYGNLSDNAAPYNLSGSMIDGYQWDGTDWGPKILNNSPALSDSHHHVGTSISHAGGEKERVGGAEVTDDVWMSTALGNAGQEPIVVWQSLDLDASATTDSPSRTIMVHDRQYSVADVAGEATAYKVYRPNNEAGWWYDAGEQRQVFIRRYNESGRTWEQMNSASGVSSPTEFTSASSTAEGFHGVDQWWSSAFWPDFALTTNPESGNTVNEVTVAWLNDSEQTVYVRGWHHESNMAMLSVVETSGTANDRALQFGAVHIGATSNLIPITIANNGNADLDILAFKINAPFEVVLTDEQRQQLAQGAIRLGRGQEIVVQLRFAPGLEDYGPQLDIMEIVSTDPVQSSYVMLLQGIGMTGAVGSIDEKVGVSNDNVLPFGFIDVGQTKTVELLIKNVSPTDVLNASLLSSLPDIYRLSTTQNATWDTSLPKVEFDVQPTSSVTVYVTFKPKSDLPVIGTVTLETNTVDPTDPFAGRKFLRLLGNSPAIADVHQITSATAGSEIAPTTGGDYVVYVASSGYPQDPDIDGDIYLYNRVSGSTPLKIGYGRDAEIWDNWVAYSGGLYNMTTGKTYAYTGLSGLIQDSTGKPITITSVSHVSADGDRLALAATTSAGQGIVVVELDRTVLQASSGWTSGALKKSWVVPEPVTGAVDDYPALYGDWVAWRVAPTSGAREATDKNIYLYNYGAINPTLPLRLTPVEGAAGYMIPQFENSRVIWMDDRWGTSTPQFFMFDVDKQKGYQLTDSFSQKGQVYSFNGNLLVWSDSRSGNWDLYAFDVEQWAKNPFAAAEVRLTYDQYNQTSPGMGGAWIAYQDDRPTKNQWDVYYAIFLSPPNISIRETSGIPGDKVLDLGDVNVGKSRGIGFEVQNIGYDPLRVSGYQLNNLAGYDIVLKRYDDANHNMRLDTGETVWDDSWAPGEPLPDLGVGGYHSIWMEWTPTTQGALPTGSSIAINSNAKMDPVYTSQITGVGVVSPDITVTPDPLKFEYSQFGDVPLGSSVRQTVWIRNTGNQPLKVTEIRSTEAPPFVVVEAANASDSSDGLVHALPDPSNGSTAWVIPVGESWAFDVVFAAPMAGSYSANIQVYNNTPRYINTGGYYELAVAGTVRTVPDIDVRNTAGTSITSLDFGQVEIGKYKDIVVRIANTGSATLLFQGTGWVSSDPSVLTVIGSLPTSGIAAGSSALVTVRYKPTQTGSLSSATIKFLTNDPDQAGAPWLHSNPVENPMTLTVQGQGIVLPHLSVIESAGVPNDNKIDFGTFAASVGSQTRTFTIKNTGTDVLRITGWSYTGDSEFQFIDLPDSGSGLVRELQPGETMTVTTQFNVTGRGDFSGTLTLFSNDTTYPAPAGYGLSMIAKVRAGEVSVSPNTLNFGNVEIGQSSTVGQFSIRNTGASALRVTLVESDNPEVFAITVPDGFDGLLDPGEVSPVYTVVFKPPTTGDYTATVKIHSDDPDRPIVTVPTMSGRGVAIPNLTVLESSGAENDAAIEFGDLIVGEFGQIQITLRNDGTGPLHFSSWSINNSVYTMTALGDQKTLEPGASRTITVTFSPTAALNYPATITILSDDPDESPFTIAVTGRGRSADVVADFNGNGQVDVGDYTMFREAFGTYKGSSGYDVKYDMNKDDVIDYGDLGIFLGYYSQSVQAAGGSIPTASPSQTGSSKLIIAAKAIQPSTDNSEGVLLRNLGIAQEMGALSEALNQAPLVSTGIGTSTSTLGPVESMAKDDTKGTLTDQAFASTGGPMGQVVIAPIVTESTSGGLGLDELLKSDPVVAPYAGALLPLS